MLGSGQVVLVSTVAFPLRRDPHCVVRSPTNLPDAEASVRAGVKRKAFIWFSSTDG